MDQWNVQLCCIVPTCFIDGCVCSYLQKAPPPQDYYCRVKNFGNLLQCTITHRKSSELWLLSNQFVQELMNELEQGVCILQVCCTGCHEMQFTSGWENLQHMYTYMYVYCRTSIGLLLLYLLIVWEECDNLSLLPHFNSKVGEWVHVVQLV